MANPSAAKASVDKAIEDFRNEGTKKRTAEEIRAQMEALATELQEVEEADRKAAMAVHAKRATALLAMMRAAYKDIESLFPGTFESEKWAAAALAQAWPRDTKFKNAADLSETETENARQVGKDLVADLKV